MKHHFLRRVDTPYPAWFCRLVDDMFAITQHWQPDANGANRGRLFEAVFHRYCDFRRLPVTERPGSRTIRHERSASGFSHESDGVLSFPDLTVHLELKHLSIPLGKNDLLIFNQKGLDHLLGGSAIFRRLPFYRIVLRGHILSQEARRFAVQWGIIVVEPDRLPLLTLHGLAGRMVPQLRGISTDIQDEIWSEVPHLLSPLQKKLQLFVQLANVAVFRTSASTVRLTSFNASRAITIGWRSTLIILAGLKTSTTPSTIQARRAGERTPSLLSRG